MTKSRLAATRGCCRRSVEELCRIVLARVIVRDRQVDAIHWVPDVRPFFERRRECPQGDSNP